MTPPERARPASWVIDFVLLAALWGASFMFMRTATLEFGALPTATLRVGIAALMLLPLLLARGLGGELRARWRPIFVMGLLNSGVPFASYAFALLWISTGLSSILNATVPLFGAVVAWLWLGERLTHLRVLGLLVGFAGVAALAAGKASFQSTGAGVASGWAVLACLLATFCYGVAASFAKRHLGGVTPLVAATGSQVAATLGLLPLAILTWPARWPSLKAWGACVMVGLLCTGLAYILYFRIIERAGPAKALAVTFLVPVFALFYGAVFLDEAITVRMLICGGLIVLGTALSTGLIRNQRAGG